MGIDGCRAGWFVVTLDESKNFEISIVEKITEVFIVKKNIPQILIDIPIGLPVTSKRACDKIARSYLTRMRSSSVFPVPGRKALYAADYQMACDINQQILGVKISKQTWNIRKKIIEVDQALVQSPSLKEHVRECHPEVAFWAMAGHQPMKYSKRSREGVAERLSWLKSVYPQSDEIYETALRTYHRKFLSRDDIIDAIALAVTAAYALRLVSIPENPQKDEQNMPMEIVYGEFG